MNTPTTATQESNADNPDVISTDEGSESNEEEVVKKSQPVARKLSLNSGGSDPSSHTQTVQEATPLSVKKRVEEDNSKEEEDEDDDEDSVSPTAGEGDNEETESEDNGGDEMDIDPPVHSPPKTADAAQVPARPESSSQNTEKRSKSKQASIPMKIIEIAKRSVTEALDLILKKKIQGFSTHSGQHAISATIPTMFTCWSTPF